MWSNLTLYGAPLLSVGRASEWLPPALEPLDPQAETRDAVHTIAAAAVSNFRIRVAFHSMGAENGARRHSSVTLDMRTRSPYSVAHRHRPVNRYRRVALLDTGPQGAIATAATNAREWRTRKGWSLAEAAREAGIGKSTLAQLEAGTANPSLETLWAISRAYGIPIGMLIGSSYGRSRTVRADQRTLVQSANHPYQIQMLLSLGPVRGLDITLLETEPGDPRTSQPHLPGSVEHVYVIQGSLLISPGDGTMAELAEGDLLSFPSAVEHSYETLIEHTRSLVIMQYS